MTEGLDLQLGVDKAAGFVGRALETAQRDAIRSGRLHPGVRLPGSRRSDRTGVAGVGGLDEQAAWQH